MGEYMPTTTVRGHKRRGSKGVKPHRRSTKKRGELVAELGRPINAINLDEIESLIGEREDALKQLQAFRKDLKKLIKDLNKLLPATGNTEKRIILEKRNIERNIQQLNIQEKIFNLELGALKEARKRVPL